MQQLHENYTIHAYEGVIIVNCYTVYFAGETDRESLALAYFTNRNLADCVFIIAAPYRQYSICE